MQNNNKKGNGLAHHGPRPIWSAGGREAAGPWPTYLALGLGGARPTWPLAGRLGQPPRPRMGLGMVAAPVGSARRPACRGKEGRLWRRGMGAGGGSSGWGGVGAGGGSSSELGLGRPWRTAEGGGARR